MSEQQHAGNCIPGSITERAENNSAYPLFQIVLLAPEIPQNTGNIGRIAVCAECKLHLVKPISFSFEDKYLKRAGMDYWHHVDCTIHESWADFLRFAGSTPIYFYSTKAKKTYWDCPMEHGSFLVFGSEGSGLPASVHQAFPERFYKIPMPGEFNRSLNLANSVAIVTYEGLRRFRAELPCPKANDQRMAATLSPGNGRAE